PSDGAHPTSASTPASAHTRRPRRLTMPSTLPHNCDLQHPHVDNTATDNPHPSLASSDRPHPSAVRCVSTASMRNGLDWLCVVVVPAIGIHGPCPATWNSPDQVVVSLITTPSASLV